MSKEYPLFNPKTQESVNGIFYSDPNQCSDVMQFYYPNADIDGIEMVLDSSTECYLIVKPREEV